MKKFVVFFTVALLFALHGKSFASESIVVVVNINNEQFLSLRDVKNIYLDNVTTWADGSPIELYETPVSSPIRKVFAEKILGMSAMDSAAMWSNKKITNIAQNPPKVRRETRVAAIVASEKNAIGYVSEKTALKTEGLRIVLRIKP